MPKTLPIFYSAILLTGVNLLLRLVGTSFQVYLSGRIGAAGIGLLQLVMSVGGLAMVAGMAGIRTGTMYLTAEELGRRKPERVTWVLSGCFLYSICFSGTIAAVLFAFAPQIAELWIGDSRTVDALRLFAAFLPATCLCGVMCGYFTAANRIGTLAAVEVAEQLCSMAVTMTALNLWAGSSAARACQCVILGSSMGCCLTLGCLVLLRLREKPQTMERNPLCRRLLRTAVPLGAADVLKSGINTTENLMVPKRLARNTLVADPLAAFGCVSGMVFPVLMFPACILFGLAELLIPELARCAAAGSSSRIRYLVKRSLKVATLYGLLFGGLMFLLAQPLCLKLYKSAEAGAYLRKSRCSQLFQLVGIAIFSVLQLDQNSRKGIVPGAEGNIVASFAGFPVGRDDITVVHDCTQSKQKLISVCSANTISFGVGFFLLECHWFSLQCPAKRIPLQMR